MSAISRLVHTAPKGRFSALFARALPLSTPLRAASLQVVPLRSFRTITNLRSAQIQDPDLLESKKQLESGNLSEAYGLSKEAGAIGESGLLDKYGLIPVGGLALAAAVSKELIILNEEVALLGCFLTAVFSGYVLLREPVKQALDEEINQIKNAMQSSFNARIEATREEIAFYRTFSQFGKDLEQFTNEFIAYVENARQRLPEKEETMMKNAIAKYLDDTLKAEATARTLVQSSMLKASVPFVRRQYHALPQKSKDEALQFAINQLKKGGATDQPNPIVLQLFRQFVKEYNPDIKGFLQQVMPAAPKLKSADELKAEKEALEEGWRKQAA